MTEKKIFDWSVYFLLVLAVVFCIYYGYSNYYHYEEKEENLSERTEVGVEQKKVEKKHEQLQQVLEAANLDTTRSDMQLLAARLLLEDGKPEVALNYYKRYESQVPLTADLYAEIGTVLWLKSPSEESLRYFMKSLKLDSVNAGGLFGFGRASLQVGDSVGAVRFFKKIIRYHPKSDIANVAKEWVNNINKMENK